MAIESQSERRFRARYARLRASRRAQVILAASVMGSTLAITGAVWLARTWRGSGVRGGMAVAVVAVLAASFIWFMPKLQLASVKEHLGPDYPKTENDVRGTWAQIIGGLVLLASLGFTWFQSNETRLTAQRSIEITERGQITDRFTSAIDQLGDDRLELRLGGIYSLEQIAVDAPESHYWPVMQVLTAFVRAHAALVDPTDALASPAANPVTATQAGPSPDVQAVLYVLGRRDVRRDTGVLDLQRTDLRGADLREARLDHVDLTGTNLEGADLTLTQLPNAKLRNANLTGALLIGAQLPDADFENASLNFAFLTNADLSDASLAHADFAGAFLDGARLHDANLTGALGLTQAQIDSATVNGGTILPPELTPPS